MPLTTTTPPRGLTAIAAKTTGGVPTAANVAPGHAAGFVLRQEYPMSKSRSKGSVPGPDDDGDGDGERRGVDLPYPRHFPAGVHRFRQLLAALIARRIREDRRNPPDSSGAGKN